MSTQEKRDELKAKIEAAEARNEERTFAKLAQDTADSATSFVKEHPLAAVAGVAVLGVAIGAMTRPGRRIGRQAGQRASKFAGYATELGVAYATGLLDAAGDAAATGKDKLEDFSDALNDNASAVKRNAAFRTGNAAAAARAITREAGKRAGRTVRDMRSRASR